MNNKILGTQYEKKICKLLSAMGYWVHFLSPDNRGAQPFDIIAVKDGKAVVGDCKTSSKKTFPISRLEDNQVMAFDKWLACGNSDPILFVLYDGITYFIPYTILQKEGKVDVTEFSGRDIDKCISK